MKRKKVKRVLTKDSSRQERLLADHSPVSREDLSTPSFNLTLFSILLGLTFAYFVYFSHQTTDMQSNIASRIIEINAINIPSPFQFLSISGHPMYHYLKRRDALKQEFVAVNRRIQNPKSTPQELAELGKEMQRILSQIAYFFPYKRMIEFNKDGSATFDPNNHKAIDTVSQVNLSFLKTQIDEIYNWNYAFTLELKDGKERIDQAMILAGGFRDEYTKARVGKYLDSLIGYLDKHYELAIPLGLTIKKYEYLLGKLSRWKIMFLSAVLSSNFLLGVLLPLFLMRTRRSRVIEVFVLVTFILGTIFLCNEAVYSISL